MIYYCARCGKAKLNKTGYCSKCNKEYCNNHYHTRQKVDRKSPTRNEYARNQNVPAKKLYEVPVKCPHCEQIRMVKKDRIPLRMPREYCDACSWCRYEEEPIIYAI